MRFAIVFDDCVLLLRVGVELLLPLLVLHPDLVEVCGPPAGAGAAFQAALGLVGGEGVGGSLVAVVDAAGDDGLVGVAFEELDDDLLADARDRDAAPGLAGPGLGDADPGGGLADGRAGTVPAET